MRSRLHSTATTHYLFVALSLIVFCVLFVRGSSFKPLVAQAKELIESDTANAGMPTVAKTASKSSRPLTTLGTPAGTSAPTVQQYRNGSINTGLAGYWNMNDGVSGDLQSLADASGNNHTATTHWGANATGMNCTVAGKFGFACLFDGVDDYASISTTAPVIAGNAFTIAAWVNPNSISGSNMFFRLRRLDRDDVSLEYTNALNPGRVRFDVFDGNGVQHLLDSSGTINPPGSWTHIVGVFTGSGMQIYINGSADPSSLTFPNATFDWTSPLGQFIGGNPYDNQSWVNGKIDELRIYNRALSADEVLQLYKFDESLAGYWKMDENSWTNDCSTPTVIDSSGNGNDGRACPTGTGPSGGVDGRIGKAGSFDGVDDYVSMPYTPSLAFTSTQTIAAWVKFNSVSLSEQVIFGQGTNDGGASGFELELGNILCGGSNAKVCLNMDAGPAPLQSATALNAGSWYHIAGVWDSSDWKIYINGVLDASKASSYSPVANTHTRVIGTRQTEATPQGHLNGTVDEFRIYNRALSADEISQLYNESAQAKLYLPLVTHVIACGDFFDDFSDPNSGWPVSNTSTALREYRDGEYRILSKQSGFLFLSKSPACDHDNYYVDVDARWVTTTGNSYGLLFGVLSGFNQYYLFDMNTDVQQYRLLRRNSGGGFTTITGPTPSSAIKAGLATNHLQARRLGSEITLYVNGTWLGDWTDGMIGGRTGTGVVASAYSVMPSADARFDNFAMTAPPAPMQSQSDSIAPATTGLRSTLEMMNESIPQWK